MSKNIKKHQKKVSKNNNSQSTKMDPKAQAPNLATTEIKNTLNKVVSAVEAVAIQKATEEKTKNITKSESIDDSKKTPQKNLDVRKNITSADFKIKTFAILMLILVIGAAGLLNFYVFPTAIVNNTEESQKKRQDQEDEKKAEIEKAEKTAKIEKENKEIGSFAGRNIDVELASWGNLNVKILDAVSPKTSENFVRLVHRGYYNGKTFDKMLEQPTTSFIQQGGSGPEDANLTTANGEPLIDEIWAVVPEYDLNPDGTQQNTLKNQPKLASEEYYKNYNPENGSVTYPKGSLVMVKSGTPNSATTPFFITLKDSLLPASYTVFGKIDEASMTVIDKISNEVDSKTPDKPLEDGSPNKEIKISKITLK